MDQDNRDAYRITEPALLHVIALAEDADLSAAAESMFATGSAAQVMTRFTALDQGFRECHARLARIDPVAAEACDWLAAQIDLLKDSVLLEMGGDDGLRRCAVSISASGIGFEHTREFGRGTLLAVHLVLLPQHEPLVCYGRVRHCRSGDGAHAIGVEFVALPADYQRRLSRHMLKAQITNKSSQAP